MLFTMQVFFSKFYVVYLTKHQWRRSNHLILVTMTCEIYIMDTQILEKINYIRNVSKKPILTMQVHQTGIGSQLIQT